MRVLGPRLGAQPARTNSTSINVAEEIESVGRSELAAVKSLLGRRFLIHLIKLMADQDAASAGH